MVEKSDDRLCLCLVAFRLMACLARRRLQVFSGIRLRTIALLGENLPRGSGNDRPGSGKPRAGVRRKGREEIRVATGLLDDLTDRCARLLVVAVEQA